MFTLIFATNNRHKVEEVKGMLNEGFDIMTLQEAGIEIEIAEPYNTLEENAREKARVINDLTRKNCFSEDTGLEVLALNGEPGVKSARYAGEDCNNKKNIYKLLLNLENEKNRSAQFRTVIALILDNRYVQFEGICIGKIAEAEKGKNGFGYDAVFIPEGSDKTFAEMSMEEKAKLSHRKKAMGKLIDYLKLIDF